MPILNIKLLRLICWGVWGWGIMSWVRGGSTPPSWFGGPWRGHDWAHEGPGCDCALKSLQSPRRSHLTSCWTGCASSMWLPRRHPGHLTNCCNLEPWGSVAKPCLNLLLGLVCRHLAMAGQKGLCEGLQIWAVDHTFASGHVGPPTRTQLKR